MVFSDVLDDLVDSIVYVTTGNGAPWQARAAMLRKRFEERGRLEALDEFCSWYQEDKYQGN